MKVYICVNIISLFDFSYCSIMAEIKTTQKQLEEIFDKKLSPLNLNNTVQELMNTVSFVSKKYEEIIEVVKIEDEKREILDENKKMKSEILCLMI